MRELNKKYEIDLIKEDKSESSEDIENEFENQEQIKKLDDKFIEKIR